MDMLLRRRALLMNQGFEVEWNQQVQNGDFLTNANYWSGGNIIDGMLQYIYYGYANFFQLNYKVNVGKPVASNIYYINTIAMSSVDSIIAPTLLYGADGIRTNVNANEWANIKGIRTSPSTGQWYCVYFMDITRLTSVKIKHFYSIDLTQMFGSGNEPTTAAQFEAWLIENNINPNEYIPYNAGEKRKMTKPSWL